ncbi:MAG: helix-turn-helix transcriptional regulator [Anaerolineae bacterium]|nr:helix-turn-helix transcriptional regulator [Anaerolineae bacterium]
MTDTELQPTAQDFKPAERFTITTLEQLKVFADPLRQQIVELVLKTPRTVKHVASEIGLAPTKLYYHFNLLEELGFITVTETRIVSGIIEKQYQASAETFAIQRSLLNPGSEDGGGLTTALDAMIDPIRREILEGAAKGIIDMSQDAPTSRRLRISRERITMTEAEAEIFYTRMDELIAELDMKKHEKTASSEAAFEYQVLIGVYPIRSTGDNS